MLKIIAKERKEEGKKGRKFDQKKKKRERKKNAEGVYLFASFGLPTFCFFCRPVLVGQHFALKAKKKGVSIAI